jgi:hypothetical protein
MADDPEAMRYGFDGFGYKYIDSGSGSDWRTRHPDAEPLYASQPTQSDAMLEGDTQTILYLLGVRHGREDERAKIAAEASQPTQSDDDAYELGKRDGYESAVQDIDMLTGGDGEYRYSTIGGERHCPDADSMKARIAERFNSQPTQSDALREALGSVIALLDTQAEPPKSVVSVQDYARWANARIGLGLVMIAPRLRAALDQSK